MATTSPAAPAASTAARITPSADPVVPGPPQNVVATAGVGEAPSGAVRVRFDAASDGGSPIIDYTISWGGGFKTVTSAGTHDITGLANGSNYAFTVTARNALGDSSPSASSRTGCGVSR